MIAGAVLCPHPPLLLPGATGGVINEVERLRQVCVDALRDLISRVPDRLVMVGGAGAGEAVGPLSSDAAAPDARIRPGPMLLSRSGSLPVSLGVGMALLVDAGISLDRVELRAVPLDLPASECSRIGADLVAGDDRVGLVVLGDGSARRRTTSPGYLDERATAFDTAVEKAFVATDLDALLNIDAALADHLWVAGRAAWQVLAGALAGAEVAADVKYSDDPFGVWYAVVEWVVG